MKPIPFAEINRELVPKDPLEQAQFGAALFEKCRLAHNAEPKTPEGKRRQKTFWLPRVRAACKLIVEARLKLPVVELPYDSPEINFDKRRFIESAKGQADLRSINAEKCFIPSPATPVIDPPDPLEDFTTYTEYDSPNWVNVTSTTITVTDMQENADVYVYKDFGVDHFYEFTHYLTTELTNVTATSRACGCLWNVSNVIEDLYYWYNNRSQALSCYWIWYASSTPHYQFKMRNSEYGGNYDDYTGINPNTTCYVTFERIATTAYAHIYSDSDRTSLIDTISVPVPSTRKYRYMLPVNSHNYGFTGKISYYLSNLDLNEVGFNPAWAEGINTHHF